MNRPLLPAPRRPGEEDAFEGSRHAFPKIQVKGRTHIAIACNSCRRSKSKCDGQRPTCSKCRKGKKECAYVAQTDALPPQVLKRKHRQLEERNNDLEDLIVFLRQLPLEQAHEVLRRLRNGEDPQELVRLLRDSAVLLGLPTADSLPNASKRNDLKACSKQMWAESAELTINMVQYGKDTHEN